MTSKLRARAAVVGIGTTETWNNPGQSSLDQLAIAVQRAAQDAGIAMHDIDGLFTSTLSHLMPALSVAEYLGLRPKVMDGTNIGGSSFIGHLSHAVMALEAGLCDVACVCYGSNQLSAGGKLATLSEPPHWEVPYGPRFPISGYALIAQRHMWDFATSREHMAEVVVASRAWAKLNPLAFEQGDLTVDDVLASRMVSDPLSKADCCLVTDGGGAIILTRADRAKDMPHPPVYVLGAAAAATHRFISSMPDMTTTGAVQSSKAAYDMAGLGPDQIDLLQLYDAFSINVILFLEDLGFCAKGEGGPFASGGRIAPGGALPVNTNGGGLSCCHPGMYGVFALIEAVTQVRGQAGARQVGKFETALVHGTGGQMSSHATAILGGASTV
ncbi:acetyl-CoA acetyltransferase [Pacificibacter marinus]|uniref:acetyl-CoA acetyltransferase n=1 Tax=Pacificibacter marinus TaxID=658057 RepID=UPI001C0700E0|nr:acetyl-CoA acetyltransferase [Pacificibacter marinus]MBU2867494.1 thiolase [Pacificibacter marinus]